LRSGAQPASRVLVAIILIVAIATAITWFESQSYVTNVFGQKIPG